MVSAELVFLAIQAGVRLYAGLRGAYVASVREATLTLPLPRAPRAADVPTIVDWFRRAAPEHRPPRDSRLHAMLDKARATPAALSDEERITLENAYNVCWTEANPPMVAAGDGAGIPQRGAPVTAADYLVLTEVRQWADGEPGVPPTGFQRVAGTLIEVAVFWFANQPGAVSEKHPAGRALRAFLVGIEDVKFSETAPRDILGDVLVSVLETVAAEPRLVAGGRREEALVTSVARTVAGALDARFKTERSTNERVEAASWAALVARAMLTAGAESVLSDPKLFLGTKTDDQSAIITDIGTAFVNLLVPDDAGVDDQTALRRLVSGAGLETVVRAALHAVGEHPGVLGLGPHRKGLTALIGDLAVTFAKAERPSSAAAAFPEIAALVLENSAAHLDALWGGDRKDVDRNLLVLATRRTLDVLAEVSRGRHDPVFARQQMIELFDTVIAEVIQNPGWVVSRVDMAQESAVLSAALRAALTALRGQTFATLSAETRLGIVKAALKAGGLQLALMHEVPHGGRDAGKIALEAVIGAVFAELANADADTTWRLARSAALVALFDVALGRFAGVSAAEATMQRRIDALRTSVARYVRRGITLEEFGDLLVTEVKTVA